MKKKLTYIILGFSIFLNVLYFKYDTVDYLWPKIEKKHFKPKLLNAKDYNRAEKTIVNASFKMLKSEEAVMVWEENYGLAKKILENNNVTNQGSFRRYNYPRAFLFYGLAKFLISKGDKKEVQILIKEFDKYITQEGQPDFKLNKVDQIVFGLTAIELYQYTKDHKYKAFLNHIDNFILDNKDSIEIINYRKEADNYLNDVLGMVVPYLQKNDNSTAAKKQLQYFIENGIDPESFLPAHSFNRHLKSKAGSSNWGRGIGWYYIALAHYYKETGEFEEEYIGITNTINKLKTTEGLWSQFPGSSDAFDASATTMFMYGQQLLNPELYTKHEILSMLANYINEDGEILQTSGDTYGVNRYSATFGKSELSQGMLLLLLANTKK